jgi:Zn-dependent M28 family amino/carboxypeptidase
MSFPRRLVALALVSACTRTPEAPPTLAKLPDIDANAALAHIKMLSSDEFGGRAPGTEGENRTIQYLTVQFKEMSLDGRIQPGNPKGGWLQKVPLIGLTPVDVAPLLVKKGEETQSFAPQTDVVAFSQRVTDAISVADAEVVFAGYGVQAPEFQWDDFKGMDVKGKVVVVLVNDPPVPDPQANDGLDPKVFGGRAMTYYGRWTYKYDKGAELGAAAVLIVHETGPAGYPFSVVQGFGGQERFDLVTADKNMRRPAIQGWLSLEAATRLFTAAGQDYQKLKAQAATRDFKPVSLGVTASMGFKQKTRTVESNNVIARLPGSDEKLRDEYVIYTAHWDHLGIGEARDGDKIYNGAVDNASGTAALLEIARALSKAKPAPKRTILFMAVTAEEQGLLGSQHYAENPLYPLEKTLANINTDANLPLWGRTRDVIVIGLGASDLDDYLRDAAKEQDRTLSPDAEPEKGSYYRSDHFNFAKVGVPALATDEGIDYRDQPPGFGKQKRDDYTANEYHAPSDHVKPDWELGGYAEHAKLLMAVGYRVAQADKYPEWKPGNEFRAIREKSLAKTR